MSETEAMKDSDRNTKIEERLAERAKSVEMGRDPYREAEQLRAIANDATKAAADKFAEAYAKDLADGDIGFPIEGAPCPLCGAASPRYCELKDTNGGECPAPPTNQEHGEG
jgi:DNA repair exonuclease SbcCD ATPase subunit